MKKFLVICLALVMGTGICLAQKPQKKAVAQLTTTVFDTDIDCPNCAKKIETNVPTLGRGIEDVKIDVKSGEVTVVYNPAKNNDATILEGFRKLHVKASIKEKK